MPPIRRPCFPRYLPSQSADPEHGDWQQKNRRTLCHDQINDTTGPLGERWRDNNYMDSPINAACFPDLRPSLENGTWTPSEDYAQYVQNHDSLNSPPEQHPFERDLSITEEYSYREPLTNHVTRGHKVSRSLKQPRNSPATLRPEYTSHGNVIRNTFQRAELPETRNERMEYQPQGCVFDEQYFQSAISPNKHWSVQAALLPTPAYSSPTESRQTPAPLPATAIPTPDTTHVVSPATLDKKFHSVFPYPTFNAVQSACFSSVYDSSYNVVVSAPTGSGKTVIFELAICRLLSLGEKKNIKIVYQAPTKALCSERARDWYQKFKSLGLQATEFTGDTSAFEARRVRSASIIITTPEKWDSVTRKWSDHRSLLETVKLVLIDEVHILKDKRGATLETVISRMKSLGTDVRFVALSATIPNSNDIAQWLGLNHTSPQIPAKKFVFSEEYRPVRLQKIVHGYNLSGNEHSFDNILDDQLPIMISQHAQGKPVLVFCFTRRSCESAAMALAEYWDMCSTGKKPWPEPSVDIGGSVRLQGLISRGVSFHHGGMERQDRASVEDAFLKGHLSIICCTSTLAVGVNFPCHTVILKGTTGYQNGKFAEYDEFEIMQMIGRAGRPQFDTSATAVILTRAETEEKYKTLGSGNKPVESTLHLNLIEHLNSEIVLGTISSVETAVQWLKGTFLAVRLRQNPSHYELSGVDCCPRTMDKKLEEICRTGVKSLAESGLIEYTIESSTVFCGTEYGRAMSTYMIRFETMRMLLNMEKNTSMEKLLNGICRAPEFDEFRIKSTERPILREMNKTQDIPFRFKESVTETWQKISVLIQTDLSRGVLPHQQRITIETKQASECLQRLLEAYALCMVSDANANGLKTALELARSLAAKAWEGHHAQLCQVPDIGPANMVKLVDKQILTVSELADLTAVQIENVLARNPPAAMKIADALKSFPRLTLDGHIIRRQRRHGQELVELDALAKVQFGNRNDSGLPRWKNRVPMVTFFAESTRGKLLHIWRGKLQEKTHPLSFFVPTTDLECVTCYITCDEVVGTIQSKRLACLDNVSDEPDLQQFSSSCDGAGSKNSKRVLDADKGMGAPKHRKIEHTYFVSSVVVGDATFDCIDLSAIDEDDAGSKQGPRLRISNTPSNYKKEDNETSILWSSSIHTVISGEISGDGTSQNPWTVDESDTTDDFDTDVFDNLELPILCVSTQSNAICFEKSRVSSEGNLQLDADKRSNSAGMEIDDAGGQLSGDIEPVNLGISNKTTDEGDKEIMSQGKICQLADMKETNQGDVQEDILEPNWVNTSDKSVIDFLRGHVKFV